MSIKVKEISKLYGNHEALNNISFEINKGEIVGFLGPNGAGKSTLMKILTGYLPQSDGQASICNLNIDEDSIETKTKIGYLPEHNPLYLDMYVREYLEFVAGVYKASAEQIDIMINKTGLSKEQHKLIGDLSKGYRQRVGLAQALLHNPEVLILDEPTTGLDPNQLVEIRALIKELGKNKTVMLSTHIMQEVEAICDRVIIINKGQIVADKPIDQLSELTGNKSVVNIEFKEEVSLSKLEQIKQVIKVRKISDHLFQITSDDSVDLRTILFNFAVEQNLTVRQLSSEEQKLEDLFHKLTQ